MGDLKVGGGECWGSSEREGASLARVAWEDLMHRWSADRALARRGAEPWPRDGRRSTGSEPGRRGAAA